MNCRKHGSYPNEGSCAVCDGLELDIKEFLETHKGLMSDLASSLMCPSCHKVVKAPFFNLGEKFNWAEGCEACSK